jgi:hypothetical protein
MSLTSAVKNRRDYYAGALMILIGIGGIADGSRYGIGSPTHMGPGFFPVMLGILIAFVGLLIAISAFLSNEPDEETFLPNKPEWVGWACIVASPIMFIVLGTYFGLIPATFGCVFVAALGDRQTTLKQALGLSLVITVVGALIFSVFLKIPFPLIRGVWQ